MKRPVLAAFLFFLPLAQPSAFSEFSDRVDAPAEEIWAAVKEVLQPYGVRKEDGEKMKMETRWVEDRIVRSSGILKKITKTTYILRYRIHIEVKREEHMWPVLTIRGTYRQRRADAPIQVSWEKAHPDTDLERDFFMRVLNKLEEKRKGS